MANPGKLNRRLTVQARILTKDDAGGRVESWIDTGEVWGEMIEQKQSEAINSDAERTTTATIFRIRYMAITSGDNRIKYHDQTYGIEGVVEEGIRNTLKLTCRAIGGLEL